MPDLTHWATTTPDALAMISPAGTRTFAELDANANKLARALRSRGLLAGDAVALIAGNQPAFVETLYGCQRAGFRLTPVNWHLTPEEAAYIVGDCEAKALIATADVAHVAAPCLEAAPDCKVALLSSPATGSESARFASGSRTSSFESYEDALAAESGEALPDPTLGTTMMYTSGTTGRPKGVHRPPAAVAAASSTSLNLAGYNEAGGDVHLCTGPLYHAAPLAFSLNAPLVYGATVVVMEKWDAEQMLQLIDQYGVTHTHVVPTMFHRLLSLPEDVRAKYDVSTLRHVLHGAAPCPVPVKRRIIEWLGPIVMEYYAAISPTAAPTSSSPAA